MTKLQDIFEAVKEESLQKHLLEAFHKSMSELYSQMHLEMAQIKKHRAMFMVKNPEIPTASMKRTWEATEEGQRELELVGYIRATSAQLKSLKNRLYSQY